MNRDKPPKPDYNRFYADTHAPSWPGAKARKTDEDCHPEFFDDPLTADGYEDYESWPDNDKWWMGHAPRSKGR